MGMTFKENVSDIRNSKVADIVAELNDFGAFVDVVDPLASSVEVQRAYGIQLLEHPTGRYDAIVLAVAHEAYRQLEEADFLAWANPKVVFADLKGIFRGRIQQMCYWSL